MLFLRASHVPVFCSAVAVFDFWGVRNRFSGSSGGLLDQEDLAGDGAGSMRGYRFALLLRPDACVGGVAETVRKQIVLQHALFMPYFFPEAPTVESAAALMRRRFGGDADGVVVGGAAPSAILDKGATPALAEVKRVRQATGAQTVTCRVATSFSLGEGSLLARNAGVSAAPQ